PPQRRRCPADPPLAGDRAPRRRGAQALRAWRSRVPPPAAAGAAPLGLRQPGHLMIRIGISACLLGDEVRYDGGHKRDLFLTTVMGPLVEWVKVCPEVESGMGTPREAM